MSLIHWIKRAIQANSIKLKKRLTSSDRIPGSHFESEALKICRNLIRLPESKLIFCPLSTKYLIINESLHIKILIQDDRIIISNSTYREVLISAEGIFKIKRIFLARISQEVESHVSKIFEANKSSMEDMAMFIQSIG